MYLKIYLSKNLVKIYRSAGAHTHGPRARGPYTMVHMLWKILAKHNLLPHLNCFFNWLSTVFKRSEKRYKVPASHGHRQCQLLFLPLNGTTQGKHPQLSMTWQHNAGCCITWWCCADVCWNRQFLEEHLSIFERRIKEDHLTWAPLVVVSDLVNFLSVRTGVPGK